MPRRSPPPAQLLDPDLRQFNVICIDARMHGRTVGLVKENFDFNVRRRRSARHSRVREVARPGDCSFA